jgi:hypothetical protein
MYTYVTMPGDKRALMRFSIFFFIITYTLNLKTFFEELKLSDAWGHRFMEL